jgi:hypothetical protein
MAPKSTAAVGLVLAAALAFPATAATPKAGSFSGSTKQGKSITFKVTPGGGKVKKIKFGFRGRCENGATTTGTVSMPGPFTINDGKFHAKSGDTFVRGTFGSSTKASGRLRQSSTSFDPVSLRQVTCTSGKVRWTAKR